MTCACNSDSVVKLDATFKRFGGKYRYRVSTERVDCENEKILVTAWKKLGKFPVFINHDKSEQVGEANVFLRDGVLVADVNVTNAAAKARVESGELSMASVGFKRVNFEMKGATMVTTEADLHEISLVPEGCNFDAHREKAAVKLYEKIQINGKWAVRKVVDGAILGEWDSEGEADKQLEKLLASGEAEQPTKLRKDELEAVLKTLKDLADNVNELKNHVSSRDSELAALKALYDDTCKAHAAECEELKAALTAAQANPLIVQADKPRPLSDEQKSLISVAVREAFRDTVQNQINFHTGRLPG